MFHKGKNTLKISFNNFDRADFEILNKFCCNFKELFDNKKQKLIYPKHFMTSFSREFVTFGKNALSIMLDSPERKTVNFFTTVNINQAYKFLHRNDLAYLPEIIFYLIKDTLPFHERGRLFLDKKITFKLC